MLRLDECQNFDDTWIQSLRSVCLSCSENACLLIELAATLGFGNDKCRPGSRDKVVSDIAVRSWRVVF